MAISFHLVTPIAVIANCFLMPLGFCILLTAAVSMACASVGFLGWANILFNNANFALITILVSMAQWFSEVPGGHFFVSGRLPFLRPDAEITILDYPRGGAMQHVSIKGAPEQMIDSGHSRYYQSLTEPYLRHAGINHLGELILTHSDVNHTGGAAALIERYEVVPRISAWGGHGTTYQK